MATLLLLTGGFIYLFFYFTYGKILEKKVVKADPESKTPAIKLRDDVDYVPTPKLILFGHHFASIAGVGPIVGPAIAMIWGYGLPLLWIWIGNVFIGKVHDYLSLMASVRYEGKSIQWIAGKLMGERTQILFNFFVLFVLILVLAAFSSIISNLFTKQPEVATAFLLFTILAVFLGYLLRILRGNYVIVTIVGLFLMPFLFYISFLFPLNLPYKMWLIFLSLYVIFASSLPVWVLLQPRDYINAWFLWIGLFIGMISVFLSFKSINFPFFTSFSPPAIEGRNSPFWPTIPLIIACGSLSGFHCLVCSGTSSKQLDKETSGLFVGAGSMFTEGMLATVVVLVIGLFGLNLIGEINVGKDYLSEIVKIGGPIGIFAKSYAKAVNSSFNFVSEKIILIFASLWVSSFATTTLDTCGRIARYILKELMEPITLKKTFFAKLQNKYLLSSIPVLLGFFLAIQGSWSLLWPSFGGANQLLASVALLTISLWVIKILKIKGTLKLLILVPSLFLWLTVTLAFLWYLFYVIPFVSSHVMNLYQKILIAIMILVMLYLNSILFINFYKSLNEKFF